LKCRRKHLPLSLNTMTTNKENQTNRNIGLYIHLPFCQRKCSYCGFISLENQPEIVIRQYLRNLLVEAELQAEELKHKDDRNNRQYSIDSIYIGGGTPSLISGKDMIFLLDGIRRNMSVTDSAEITMESNPNSLTVKNLQDYYKAGINRLSIGVQSFDDGTLSSIGRLHDSACAVSAVGMAKNEGFENINIDLMFGLPGQTFNQWEESLNAAISLSPTHLSLYTLQIEEGTKLYKDYKADKLPLVDLKVDRASYHYAIQFLKKNGYNHYEISNFAKDNYVCRHNMKYWSLEEFIGLGLNASSYLDGIRWKNVSKMDQWTSIIDNKKLPIDIESIHQETHKDAMSTFIFTGLRRTEGISFVEFRSLFGLDFMNAYPEVMNQLKQYRNKGLLDWTNINTGRLWITEAGIDHSNEIMCEFV
jgi:oxygen-independent coproporphyrinogen III oxidase